MNALRKSTAIAVFFFLIFLNNKTYLQDAPEYELEKIVVTGGRTPITFSQLSRNVIMIDKHEIEQLPVSSVQDLLQYASGIDLKQRGVKGTQSDVSIRGGSFEQTLIMIDGIKVSDPQTGHHNLNLPLSLDQIERVEILKGQASRIFGPNAFSGAINFITKKALENRLDLNLSGGTYNSYEASVHGALAVGQTSNHISVSKQKADGYITNTNYDLQNISYNMTYGFGSGAINFFAGYADQKFGANSFYTTSYPKQWERVKIKMFTLSGDLGNDIFVLSPKIFWRNKNDEFLLDYSDPGFYRNLHETDSYGIELQTSLTTDLGVTSIGGELSVDKINSTNLDEHKRENKGIFFEQQFSPIENLNMSAGAYLYNYAGIGWKFWPGLDLAYQLTDNTKIFGSFGQAFRIPSYTDLYYSDPVTLGNINLKSEETTNYELGITYDSFLFHIDVSLFRKEGKNIIDWIKEDDDSQWRAENITEVNTNGLEFSTAINLSQLSLPRIFEKFSISYIYLDSDKTSGNYKSRYILDYLKHQVISGVYLNYFDYLKQSIHIRYENRAYFENQLLVDMHLSRDIFMGQLFVKVTNIFDKTFHDISGVVLPGRWITVGYKISLL